MKVSRWLTEDSTTMLKLMKWPIDLLALSNVVKVEPLRLTSAFETKNEKFISIVRFYTFSHTIGALFVFVGVWLIISDWTWRVVAEIGRVGVEGCWGLGDEDNWGRTSSVVTFVDWKSTNKIIIFVFDENRTNRWCISLKIRRSNLKICWCCWCIDERWCCRLRMCYSSRMLIFICW